MAKKHTNAELHQRWVQQREAAEIADKHSEIIDKLAAQKARALVKKKRNKPVRKRTKPSLLTRFARALIRYFAK